MTTINSIGVMSNHYQNSRAYQGQVRYNTQTPSFRGATTVVNNPTVKKGFLASAAALVTGIFTKIAIDNIKETPEQRAMKKIDEYEKCSKEDLLRLVNRGKKLETSEVAEQCDNIEQRAKLCKQKYADIMNKLSAGSTIELGSRYLGNDDSEIYADINDVNAEAKKYYYKGWGDTLEPFPIDIMYEVLDAADRNIEKDLNDIRKRKLEELCKIDSFDISYYDHEGNLDILNEKLDKLEKLYKEKTEKLIPYCEKNGISPEEYLAKLNQDYTGKKQMLEQSIYIAKRM